MDNDSVINELNTVLRGELMAAESYDLFISNTDDEKIRQIFGQFRADHKEHAELLAERIRSLGAAPGKGTGIPGMFSQIKLEFETRRKDSEEILKRAYFGEDKGVKMTEEIVKGDLDPESAELVGRILSKDREHLIAMMEIMQENLKQENDVKIRANDRQRWENDSQGQNFLN
ncbi:MAG: ferritin-like domain-containing protein [Clostridiaceae bacterium]|jgi:bacterioferritin|nr:ferritin-like domain-containing protein [Clostridiaceae bacterium]